MKHWALSLNLASVSFVHQDSILPTALYSLPVSSKPCYNEIKLDSAHATKHTCQTILNLLSSHAPLQRQYHQNSSSQGNWRQKMEVEECQRETLFH